MRTTKRYTPLCLLAATLLTACSSQTEWEQPAETPQDALHAIRFEVTKRNMTKGGTIISGGGGTPAGSSSLQDQGHYNFGVFAFKSSDASHDIMADYLVGYCDNQANKGYKMDPSTQSTLGQSYWAYEKLGYGEGEYTHATNETGESYYTTADDFYMSNIEHQFLRYWDLSSDYTHFYAYAPYYHHASTEEGVTFDNATHTLTFPAGSLRASYDDVTRYEQMVAATKVEKSQYGQPVSLQFQRLNARIRIAFYEVIDGYSVQILGLKDEVNGVSAAPAVYNTTSSTYEAGTLYTSAGATVTFGGTEGTDPTVKFTPDGKLADATQKYLLFQAPVETEIGETNGTAAKSPTTYYALPMMTATNTTSGVTTNEETGLTFHVTYRLTSTTGETITVHDAKVHVPAAECKWQSNYAYTYIFKITKNSSGSTATPNPDDIHPEGVDPGAGSALFPIIFDQCTVVDYTTQESEDVIN